jgi:hypothetical protein
MSRPALSFCLPHPTLPPMVALVLTCLATACGGPLHTAVDAFHHADYPQAAREFRLAGNSGVEPEDAPRFHLYCGLNHLALGNARLAVVHLTHARYTFDNDVLYFSVDERARLLSAWKSLGRMPGQRLE